MSAFFYDLRLAVRALAARPGFSTAVVATLGLGVGLVSAVLLVVNGVLLRPLPYPDAERLVVLGDRTKDAEGVATSVPNFQAWREQASSFSAMAVAVAKRETVTGVGDPVRVPTLFVSADYFEVAGVSPRVGRAILPTENREEGPPVAVVSERFWRESLDAPPSLDGVTVRTTDLWNRAVLFQVVGVMPAGFELMGTADVYLPFDRSVGWNAWANHVVPVIGRLAPGATPAGAAAELATIQARVRADHPEVETEVSMQLLGDKVLGPTRRPLGLLSAGALLLLLIAFANVAGALLARGVVRQGEFRLRAALGASRRRLILQLCGESAVLACASGALAALVARGLLGLIGLLDPGIMPRLDQVAPSWLPLVLSVAFLASLGVVLFGGGTALIATRWAAPSLGSRSGSQSRRERRVWRALLSAEVALAFTLLVAAGLLGRSLWEISAQNSGFDPDDVVTLDVSPSGGQYETRADFVRYVDRALGTLRGTPGVEAAGVNVLLPLANGGSVGGPPQLESGGEPDGIVQYRVADEGYFDAMRVRLRSGRLFDERDDAGAPHAAVVNESLARRLWPDADPIGQRMKLPMDQLGGEWLTVIGVVDEERPWNQPAGTWPTTYVSYRQRPDFLMFVGTTLVARTAPGVVTPDALRRALIEADPDIPVQAGTLVERMGRTTADRRFVFSLLGLFGGLALLLVAIGIWSISSFIIQRRVREMGIRLALGAEPRQVRRSLQLEAMIPLGFGLAVGALLAVGLSRLIGSLLFGIGALDPMTFAAATLTLALTTWLSSWSPARRITHVDPLEALGSE